jgi:uncharacterized protein YjiS (DUF1127 family)
MRRNSIEWEHNAMFNVRRQQLDKSTGYLLQDLPGAHFVPRRFISDKPGLHKVFRWFHEERLRYAMIRSLNRLNDDHLDDIGIKRKDIRPIVNAVIRCIRKRRLGGQQYPIFTLSRMAAGTLPGRTSTALF